MLYITHKTTFLLHFLPIEMHYTFFLLSRIYKRQQVLFWVAVDTEHLAAKWLLTHFYSTARQNLPNSRFSGCRNASIRGGLGLAVSAGRKEAFHRG